MNGCLITYVEKDIFKNIDKDKIIQWFRHMRKCHGQKKKV